MIKFRLKQIKFIGPLKSVRAGFNCIQSSEGVWLMVSTDTTINQRNVEIGSCKISAEGGGAEIRPIQSLSKAGGTAEANLDGLRQGSCVKKSAAAKA